MRIGILTHHYVKNYGAFLQMKAMYETLRRLYPKAEIVVVNYVNPRHWRKNIILAVDYLFCSKNFGKWILCFKFICCNQYGVYSHCRAIAIACLDLSNYTGSRRCVSVRENNRRCKWNNSSYQHYQYSDWVEFVLFFEYGISERFNGVYGKNGHYSCRSYFWASGILCNVLRTYYSFGIVYVAK